MTPKATIIRPVPVAATALAAVAGAWLAWSPVAGADTQEPGAVADLVDRASPAVVTVLAAHEGDAMAQAMPEGSPFGPGSPFEDFFRQFGLPEGGPIAAAAAAGWPGGRGPRLRLRDRPGRLHRHQQPRGRRRRQREGAPQRRARVRRQGDRHRPADRPCADPDRRRRPAAARARRQRQRARRRGCDRRRQPVRPRRHGDPRHRLGDGARHQRRALRRLHPDRRGDQPRQLGRPAAQHAGRGDRRELGDLLAERRLGRRRLRHSVEHGEGGRGAAPLRRRGRARLARRDDPERHPGDRHRDRHGRPARCARLRRADGRPRGRQARDRRRHRLLRRQAGRVRAASCRSSSPPSRPTRR